MQYHPVLQINENLLQPDTACSRLTFSIPIPVTSNCWIRREIFVENRKTELNRIGCLLIWEKSMKMSSSTMIDHNNSVWLEKVKVKVFRFYISTILPRG